MIFDPLSHDQLRKVARFQMMDIALHLAQRGVALAITDAAWDVVVSESYDMVNPSFLSSLSSLIISIELED